MSGLIIGLNQAVQLDIYGASKLKHNTGDVKADLEIDEFKGRRSAGFYEGIILAVTLFHSSTARQCVFTCMRGDA